MTERIPIGADGLEFQRVAYTPAMRVGDLIFVSGQVAMNDRGESVAPGDVLEQGRVAMRRLRDVLRAAGSDLSQVVKVTVFLTDRDQFPALVQLRREWFSPPYPADTTVIVDSLVREECLIEIEAIATVAASTGEAS